MPTLIAAVALAASPAMVDAWACGPGFYGLTRPMVIPVPEEIRQQQLELLRQQKIMANRLRNKISSNNNGSNNGIFQPTYFPRYEIVDNDEKFQVAIDVPGVKMQDIDITLEDDGTILSIYGERKSWNEANAAVTSSAKFIKSFSLDPTVDVEKFTANLQNGVLIVSAPKEMKRVQERIRKIPVSEWMEKENDDDEDATAAAAATTTKATQGERASDDAENISYKGYSHRPG